MLYGKIYKLVNIITNEIIYIGSTTGELSHRIAQHRYECRHKKGRQLKLYNKLNEIGLENIKIVLIEEIECENRDQLRAKEDYWICHFNIIENGCNFERASRNKKQYREENKEAISEWKKQWCIDNKEKILEKNKEYYNKNKEIIKEKRKQYHEQNKQIINEKRKEKIQCKCGTYLTKPHLKRHQRTKIHQDLLFNNLMEELQSCYAIID